MHGNKTAAHESHKPARDTIVLRGGTRADLGAAIDHDHLVGQAHASTLNRQLTEALDTPCSATSLSVQPAYCETNSISALYRTPKQATQHNSRRRSFIWKNRKAPDALSPLLAAKQSARTDHGSKSHKISQMCARRPTKANEEGNSAVGREWPLGSWKVSQVRDLGRERYIHSHCNSNACS